MRHELSPSVMPGLVLAILFAALATTGCQTTVGNYLGNRARDLGEFSFVQAVIGSCESRNPDLVRRKL